MRGRKPKPVEQRRREGNMGKRPLPDVLLVAGRGSLGPPPDSLNDDARDVWLQIVGELEQAGIVDIVDALALEHLCVMCGRARQARRVLDGDGLFALGSMGQITAHPALAIEKDAASLFLRFAEQYALTPVARTRLGLAHLQGRSIAQDLHDRLGNNPIEKAAG